MTNKMYTIEKLEKMSNDRLVSLYLKLQTEAEYSKRCLDKINKIASKERNPNERRGRPKHTPEQRAAAYEALKARKRQEYALRKTQKTI